MPPHGSEGTRLPDMEGLRGAGTQGNELLLQEEGRTGAGQSETTEAASAGMQ